MVNWLKCDWENRHTHASSLLAEVRLGFVPEEMLTELLDGNILEIPECKALLQETLDGQKKTCSKRELSKQMPKFFATRSTITVSCLIPRFGFGYSVNR